ncbi:MAG: efflux transporter outer membrane subunit [Hyphomonadaceae bacterium]
MRWSKTAVWLLLATTTALSGCASVGPQFAPPQVEAPPHFPEVGATSDETRVSARWWSAFGASQLDALVEEAMCNSPTVAEADATLDAARAARDAAFGGLFPQIDAVTGAERTRVNAAAFGFEGFPTVEVSRYTAGVGVSYDLDLFGGQRRARESAGAWLEAELFRNHAARLTLAADITATAIDAAVASAELETIERIVLDDAQTLDLVERALAAGAVAHLDRIRAQSQLAQDASEIPRIRSRLAGAQTQLSILVGRTPGAGAPIGFALDDFEVPLTPQSVPSALLRGRPDILAAEAALHAATADIGVRVASLYPQIRLSGDYTQTSLRPDTLFQYSSAGWSLGPTIRLPLFNGGSLRAEVRRAEADARRADARYRATVLRAFGQVTNAYVEVALAAEQRDLLGQSLALAEENLRLSRRAYETGAGTLLGVIDAQRQANLARRAHVRAVGGHLAAIAKLYSAISTAPLG